MAYEVTKQIKGRQYRYRVEGVRDPSTGQTRARWQYLGRLGEGGVVAPSRVSSPRVTRDEIVAVTARLLESRDASRVTVAVIAQNAGVSPGTFYRHFADRNSAFSAALTFLCDRLLADLPSLDGTPGTREAEQARLYDWFAALHGEVLNRRALRWYLTIPDRGKPALLERAMLAVDPHDLLVRYFQALRVAKLTNAPDLDALAIGVMTVHRAAIQLMAMRDDGSEAEWDAMYPVITRAIFCD